MAGLLRQHAQQRPSDTHSSELFPESFRTAGIDVTS